MSSETTTALAADIVAWAEQQAANVLVKYQPAATGRPSALGDDKVLTDLLAAVAAGNYLEVACDYAGLDRSTITRWQQKAESGDVGAQEFCKALKRAETLAEIAAVDSVRSHWGKEWASAMTYLERRKPERWSKRDADGAGGPRVVVQIGIRDSDVQITTLSPVSRNELQVENSR